MIALIYLLMRLGQCVEGLLFNNNINDQYNQTHLHSLKIV